MYFHAQNCSWTNGSSSQDPGILPTLGHLSLSVDPLGSYHAEEKWVVHTNLKGSAATYSSNHGDLKWNYGLKLHYSVFTLTFLSFKVAEKWFELWRMWEPILKCAVSMTVHGKGSLGSPSSSEGDFPNCAPWEKKHFCG